MQLNEEFQTVTIGDKNDLCSKLIAARAEILGGKHIHLCEETYGDSWAFSQETEVSILVNEQSIPLRNTFLFPRFSSTPNFKTENIEPDILHSVLRERRSSINYFLLKINVPVINRPYCGLENGSKPLQMFELSEFGFTVPEWIATNDKIVANNFADKFANGAIYKSISGLRSSVGKVDDITNDETKQITTPIIVQNYIEGDDVRVHVIGQSCIATIARGSKLVDYRDPGSDVKYSSIDVPTNLHKLMVNYSATAGVALSGFDFKIGSDGVWHCLEMNPAPTFATYELSTGQQISTEIIRSAISGAPIL